MAPGNSLDRVAPVCCGAVEEWVRHKHLERHKQKVQASKTLITNKWSDREEERIQASRRNVKREHKQEERFNDIESENRRLLNVMQAIERRGPAKAAAMLALGGGGGGAAALGQHTATRSASVPAGGLGRAGSQVTARVRELRRIDFENQRLLKRLQGTKASVDLNKFDAEHQRQQKFMRMRCEHQHQEEREAAKAANAAIRERFFSVREELSPEDEEFSRLLKLQQELRRQVGEDPADECGAEGGSRPASSSSARLAAAAGPSAGSASAPSSPAKETTPRRRLLVASPLHFIDFGGTIPSHSRKIVEELMANHAREAEAADASEAEAEAAKEAAARAFEAATSIDVSSATYEERIRGPRPMGYSDFIAARSLPQVPAY